MRLTGETVGIRLSVCPSPSVRLSRWTARRCPPPPLQSLLAFFYFVILIYGCGPESGGAPCVSVFIMTSQITKRAASSSSTTSLSKFSSAVAYMGYTAN